MFKTNVAWPWMNPNDSTQFHQPTGGLTTKVDKLRLRVGSHLTLFYIHQMNQMNSYNNFILMAAP